MKRKIFGEHDEKTIQQFDRCLNTGNVIGGVLCADGHYGYSQPVGGSSSMTVRFPHREWGLTSHAATKRLKPTSSMRTSRIRFHRSWTTWPAQSRLGSGETTRKNWTSELFDDEAWDVYEAIGRKEHDTLKKLARNQLGTVGSGNHFVDILIDTETEEVWVANHFGSRGSGTNRRPAF